MIELSDIEYLVLLAAFVIGLCLSLKRREVVGNPQWGGVISWFTIDKDCSVLAKAFACVFILMGHFANRDIRMGVNTVLDTAVYYTTANVALAVFMFFSGYGLSLKDYQSCSLIKEWFHRFKKIYFPLLFIGVIYVIICFLLPDKFSMEIVQGRNLPKLIHELSNFNSNSWPVLSKALFGYTDWYVVCILYFYTFFYVAQFVAKRTGLNFTIILSVIMLLYFLAAFFVYGWEEAHFFRYPCAFVIGHLIAKHNRFNVKRKERIMDVVITFVFLATVAFHGVRWLIYYALALVFLYFFSRLSRYFEVKRNSILFVLGTVSYFFYLSHERICYTLMYYMGIDDLLFWVVFTGFTSYLLWFVYKKIENRVLVQKG